MDKPVETLKNMNLETAKHAQWVVRVLAPKLIRYSFQSKQKTVQAEKFQCLLVSTIPTQFMIGSVPFNFATPDAAQKAFQKFKSGLCFRVQQPEFDGKMKTEYISTPHQKGTATDQPCDSCSRTANRHRHAEGRRRSRGRGHELDGRSGPLEPNVLASDPDFVRSNTPDTIVESDRQGEEPQ